MSSDFHIHTQYCGHARGKTVDYIETAIGYGLDEIGFADHLGRYYLSKSQRKRYWDWGMDNSKLDRYYSELTELKDVYENQIKIRIGLEVDYVDGAEELLKTIIEPYKLDFLLGSIHCIPSLGWSHLAKCVNATPDLIYKTYFESAKLAIESKLFESLAHIDFVWRYIPWPAVRDNLILKEIDEVVKCAAANNVCIEINSNNYQWSLGQEKKTTNQTDLFLFLLESIKRNSASITLGSDAHTPDSVGHSFENIILILKEYGISRQTVFRSRIPSQKEF